MGEWERQVGLGLAGVHGGDAVGDEGWKSQ